MVDASVVVTAVLDDGHDGRRVRGRLRGNALAAPEIVDLEVLSVIRRLVATRRVTGARASRAIDDLAAIPIERASHRPLVVRCWELRHNLSPYDAAYVALAEALSTVLLTGDLRMAGAPEIRCDVEVLS